MAGTTAGLLRLTSKEIGDAYRSWRLQVLTVLFVLLGGGVGYFVNEDPAPVLLFIFPFLVPLVALIFSHHTIVQKRTSNELTVLLSLPFSRFSVVVGAFLGRVVLVTWLLVTFFAALGVTGVLTGAVMDPAALAGAFLIATIFGIVFVSLAVGLSAAVRTNAAASVGVFGLYFLLALQFWNSLPRVVLAGLEQLGYTPRDPTWPAVFLQLAPFAAVRNALAEYYPELTDVPPIAASAAAEQAPAYTQPWFAWIVVLCWIVGPVMLGYFFFRRADL